MESTSTKRVLESPNDCRLEPNFSTDCGLLFIESFDLDWSVPSTQACLSQSRRFHVLSIRFEECFSTVQTLVVKPLLGPYWAIMFCVVGVGGWVTVNWDRMFDWMFGVGPNVPAKYTELQTLKIWRIFFIYIYILISFVIHTDERRLLVRGISLHLVYYSIRRQDDGNAAIANTNTSKLGAVVCWCPDVYSARPISHVFPSLGFPDLRWFPSTPGSDPVCLSTKDQDHEMENKFLSGNKSTKGGISKSRRNELERKLSNKTERGYIIEKQSTAE